MSSSVSSIQSSPEKGMTDAWWRADGNSENSSPWSSRNTTPQSSPTKPMRSNIVTPGSSPLKRSFARIDLESSDSPKQSSGSPTKKARVAVRQLFADFDEPAKKEP